MTYAFLHSSDLHLGKAFGNYPESIRGRLREARHGAITRLATAARAAGVRDVLLAGDTFDVETPAPETLRHALHAMAAAVDLRWILLPGNHDSLAASELWRRLRADGPANLWPLADDAPAELAPGAWLLPAPCTRRRPGRDLTQAMDAPTPDGAYRIGLAHGAITDFSGEDAGTPGIIPPDRAGRSGLDYLALGDWHGQMAVGPATWYSGTPEPDGFKHDALAGALVVRLTAPGTAPQVTPVPTAQFRWLRPELDLLPGEDAAARLAELLPPPAARRDMLLRLVVRGRLALADRLTLATMLDRLAPDFGWFAADLTALTSVVDTTDLDRIDRGGALRRAAEALLTQSRDPTQTADDRALAERALLRLHALVHELPAAEA